MELDLKNGTIRQKLTTIIACVVDAIKRKRKNF